LVKWLTKEYNNILDDEKWFSSVKTFDVERETMFAKILLLFLKLR